MGKGFVFKLVAGKRAFTRFFDCMLLATFLGPFLGVPW
jgi:hypothetical protein